ncbi:PAS domain S-box-containing protein/diguanylate cyclase (GGDEF)-like protein [Paraburkholderia caballeronis]|nr:PAS domain S-box-containing protein/diguanylate cyclase (GGDEF)-like protein [Paraburkholderia caballeronis]TDV22054.1 PAS domain S-box-containing protein/diguanylate cyclase (GGDEF)-like protein [Paraburkholderia caballeronis]TDV28958.1 PAS domain S-box-containing protein/diguanylate cyclase (GGDEF)-like protein [Paraburkholderia caballeronis]
MLAPPTSAEAADTVSHAAPAVPAADALLDSLMRLAAQYFGVDAACVMPGAPDERWIGAGIDVPLRDALDELRRAIDARDTSEPLVVTDTLAARALVGDLLPTASTLPFRFAAVWPLRAPDGQTVGSLCLLGREPRELTAEDRASLDDFARVAAALAAKPAIDATQRAEAAELRARERLLSLAIAGSGTGVWDRNVVTGEIHYSSGWKAMLGYADDEVSDRIEDSYVRLHPDDVAYVKATMHAHFEGLTPNYEVEHRIRCKDGSYKWICSRGKVVSRDEAGNALRMIGTSTDVTSMRAMSETLRETVSLITSLTNEVPGLVFQCRLRPDGHSFFSYASAGIAEIYELTPDQVATSSACIDALIHPDDFEVYRASLQTSAERLSPWHLEYRVQLPQQGLRWRQGDAKPQRLADGSTLWHGFITDATERKRIEAELHEFATIDSLTRLPNRRHFMAQLEARLASLRRNGAPASAVMMCDLDHFKSINDHWGHAVGDQALRHFADVLRSHLRADDVAGRIGGEEFAVLLGSVDLEGALAVAQRIRLQIAGHPLVIDDDHIRLTVSIGVTEITGVDADAGAALSRSDLALYRAKKNGRNRIESQ